MSWNLPLDEYCPNSPWVDMSGISSFLFSSLVGPGSPKEEMKEKKVTRLVDGDSLMESTQGWRGSSWFLRSLDRPLGYLWVLWVTSKPVKTVTKGEAWRKTQSGPRGGHPEENPRGTPFMTHRQELQLNSLPVDRFCFQANPGRLGDTRNWVPREFSRHSLGCSVSWRCVRGFPSGFPLACQVPDLWVLCDWQAVGSPGDPGILRGRNPDRHASNLLRELSFPMVGPPLDGGNSFPRVLRPGHLVAPP